MLWLESNQKIHIAYGVHIPMTSNKVEAVIMHTYYMHTYMRIVYN